MKMVGRKIPAYIVQRNNFFSFQLPVSSYLLDCPLFSPGSLRKGGGQE